MNDNGEYQFEIWDVGNYIRIIPMKQLYPSAANTWDRNWIESKIDINASPFNGIYNVSLRADDFERFKQELSRIYRDMSGATKFESLENEIEINVKGDGLGHFKAHCRATQKRSMDLVELSFILDFDQSHIPGIIRQLEEITTAFPVVEDNHGK